MTDRGEQISKRVDYVAKDAGAQTATGVVMVPYTVDHHGDWERPGTIRDFADQFDAFVDAGEADGGIMHAVWPSDWMTLERNEVLEEAETIGGKEVPAEAWVQTWQYNDDELWSLVEDDILGGHSIGADAVDWDYNGEDPEALPEEVDIPDEVDVDEYFELEDGIVREVSAVDIPAVTDAQILTASKARAATARKRVADHLGNYDAFLEEMLERGHDEAAAERVWDVLDRAVNVEGAGEPGANKSLTDAARAFVNELTRGALGSNQSTGPQVQAAKDASEGDTSDDGGSETEAADDTTMSDDEPPEWAKDLIEQTKENAERLDEIQSSDAEKDDDPLEDAPEWAKEVVEQTEKNAERIDEISKQTGATQSQQLGGAEQSGGDAGIDKRAAWFTPQSKQHLLAEQSGGDN
ncbi:XkdF-like putative serine protease domain-containing protein [Halolamina rubra]|uniref:XkdF-like putative serine protease domain-containing protein n=1 Tax=Halolamina rubra TaxID=1380430 RepID=UPI000678F03D|nr:XkdF-like putative serine protease domain-containing protein [Halolamina rubra]